MGDLLHHAVGEIVFVRVAGQVGEGQHGDRRATGDHRGPPGLNVRGVAPGDQGPDAVDDLAPSRRLNDVRLPAHADALDLVERQWRQGCIDAELNELAALERQLGFAADPWRLDRVLRPEDQDRLGGAELRLDDVGVEPVRRQRLVEPDRVPFAAQRLGHGHGDVHGGTRIRDDHLVQALVRQRCVLFAHAQSF